MTSQAQQSKAWIIYSLRYRLTLLASLKISLNYFDRMSVRNKVGTKINSPSKEGLVKKN